MPIPESTSWRYVKITTIPEILENEISHSQILSGIPEVASVRTATFDPDT
jgi:hypothetical protein